MQRPATLNVTIMFNVNRVTEQGPPLAIIVLNVMPGIEKVPQPRQVFMLNREMSGRPRHLRTPPVRAGTLRARYPRQEGAVTSRVLCQWT